MLRGKIHVFHFDQAKGRRLKNESSISRVSVHSHLINIGLIDYVKSLPVDGLLFVRPRQRNAGGKGRETVGDSVEKWWAILIGRCGVEGKKNLYSLRHTVMTRFAAAGVSQDIGENLAGRAWMPYMARLTCIVRG